MNSSGMNATAKVGPIVMSPDDPEYTFRYFGLTIGFWTMFVGTIGNTLTILTYFANKKMRTTFNLLLLNLAVVDFCSSILMLPFHVAGYFQLQWPFGNDSWTTRLQAFNYFCCGYTSIVFLVVITANRFIGAVFPARYKEMFSNERMIWILIVSNIFAPVFLLPFLVGTNPSCKSPGNALTGFNSKQLLCTFVCLPKAGWDPYMQFTRALFQILPLVFMIVIYSIIFVSVHSKRKNLNQSMSKIFKLSQSSSGRSLVSTNNTTVEKQKTAKDRSMSVTVDKRRKEDRRMLAISVAICVGFMITFLPSVIVNLFPYSYRTKIDIRWHMAASNLAWLNSSLNPLIYVVLNRRFRREYWRIIRLAIGSLRERFVHDTNYTTGASISSQGSNAEVGKK